MAEKHYLEFTARITDCGDTSTTFYEVGCRIDIKRVSKILPSLRNRERMVMTCDECCSHCICDDYSVLTRVVVLRFGGWLFLKRPYGACMCPVVVALAPV